MALYPDKNQIDELRNGPADTPVVMVNLLVFKNRSSYRKYQLAIAKLLPKYGAKLVWAGEMRSTVIGENVPAFESIYLVQYPTHDAFLEMTSSPAYLEDKIHREEGLESQWLLATTPDPMFQ
ncbi:MAG: DUF1330 domain-containing protein [Parvibaculales bacterium]